MKIKKNSNAQNKINKKRRDKNENIRKNCFNNIIIHNITNISITLCISIWMGRYEICRRHYTNYISRRNII